MPVIPLTAAERRTTPLEEAYAHFRLDRQGLPVSPATLRLYEVTERINEERERLGLAPVEADFVEALNIAARETRDGQAPARRHRRTPCRLARRGSGGRARPRPAGTCAPPGRRGAANGTRCRLPPAGHGRSN